MNTKENYKIVLDNISSAFSYDNLSFNNVISVEDINNLSTNINNYIDILSALQNEQFCQFVADPYAYIETVTDCAFPRVKYFNNTTENIKVVNADSMINGLPLSSTDFHLMVQNPNNETIKFVTSINGNYGDLSGIQQIILNGESYSYTENNQGIINLGNLLTGNNYLKTINGSSGKILLPSGIIYKNNIITCSSDGTLDLTDFTNLYLNTSSTTFNTLYIENVDEDDPNSVINLKYMKDHQNLLKIKSYNTTIRNLSTSINAPTSADIPIINDSNFISYIYGIQNNQYKKIIGYNTANQGECRFQINLYSKGIPLTFIALTDNCSVCLSKIGSPNVIDLSCSINFQPYSKKETDFEIQIPKGSIISFIGNNNTFSKNSNNYYKFVTNGKMVCYGNVMSLVNWANNIETSAQFYGLFSGTTIEKAPQLPATILTDSCYQNMFTNCTNLIVPPTLPATILAQNCYSHMFEGCTSLSTIPILPATDLTTRCYQAMFKGCTSLTIIPYYQLPATTLANNCYDSMFSACINITDGPLLPATLLNNNCYSNMFKDCTSLSAIHANATPSLLNSTIYASNWLNGISNATTFYNTEVWNNLKAINGEYFYYNDSNIISNCNRIARSLQDTPLSFEIINTDTDKPSGNFCFRALQYILSSNIFKNYYYSTKDEKSKVINMNTKFKYYNPISHQLIKSEKSDVDGWITQSFTWKTDGTPYTLTHFKYPFSTKTYRKEGFIFSLKSDYFSFGLNSNKTKVLLWRLCHTHNMKYKIIGNLNSLIGGRDRVNPYQFFSLFGNLNCGENHHTIGFVDAHQLILPMKELGEHCYQNMFRGCTSLKAGPSNLPAITLVNHCYQKMFQDCTSLTTIPNIQAKNLALSCCMEMFINCSSLIISPPINNINYTSEYCFKSMFENCTNLIYFQDLNTSSISVDSYQNMFNNCSNLLYPPSLNSKIVSENGCKQMFNNCSSLTYIPPLLMNTINSYSYMSMFNNCIDVKGKYVYLPATKLVNGCYENMFRNVPISGIAVKFTSWNDNSITIENTINWLNGVASNGIFYCYPDLEVLNRGSNTVPSNWNLIDSVKGINLLFNKSTDITIGNIQLFYLAK